MSIPARRIGRTPFDVRQTPSVRRRPYDVEDRGSTVAKERSYVEGRTSKAANRTMHSSTIPLHVKCNAAQRAQKTKNNPRTNLYLVICAQEQPHIGEGARVQGVPDGVGLAVA